MLFVWPGTDSGTTKIGELLLRRKLPARLGVAGVAR